MPASIRITLYDSPGGTQVGPVTTDASRNDLRKGYQVVCESVYESNSYSWALAFTPDSLGPPAASGSDFDGTPSLAALLPPEGSTSRTCKFNVDWDGAYLIRLVVDAGLSTEATTFIRLRVMTLFGDIKLLAAGERRDQTGVVPVDASPEGWANDQNQNMQRLLSLVRRVSSSGRVLYVDANRGRDRSEDPNDPDNIIRMPGPDSVARDQSGFRIRAVGFADFSSINDAIAYAETATTRGEPAPSELNPYWIMVAPGYYEEALDLKPNIHVAAQDAGLPEFLLDGTTLFRSGSVIIRVPSGSTQGTHLGTGTMTVVTSPQFCILCGLQLESAESNVLPCLEVDGILAYLVNSSITKFGVTGDGAGVQSGSVGGFIGFYSHLIGSLTGSSYSGVRVEDEGLLALFHCIVQGANGAFVRGGSSSTLTYFSLFSAFHANGWGMDLQGDCRLDFSQSFRQVGGGTGGAFQYSCPVGSSDSPTPAIKHCSLDGDVTIDGSNTSGTVVASFGASTAPTSSSVSTIGGNVTLQGLHLIGGGGGVGGVHFEDTAVAYTITDDSVILCDSSANAITINLPANPSVGQTVNVKDAGNNALAVPITVTTGGANVFETSLGGGATYSIAVNSASYTFCYYGGVWYAV